MGTLCAVSKERREGVVVCSLPAHMLLFAAFRRPWVAQLVVPRVEAVSDLLRV
eukprot:CAMPEP_0180411982 /NCGR_PEP_ID=MMETSP0989-20121125/44293_1 /TAXON_ID=697907 /ORGANISM="non described non described, Strain CCMP2293" /LENGTH=52 /DNA_ID=CAMNT_0022416409 /DNA_START=67 /DNA_END=225 /DNA_ORIENTATION=-